MSIALRCNKCKEWVWRPDRNHEVCPCGQLKVTSDSKVYGLYIEFWNESKDIHHKYDTPRGV